MGFLLEVLKSRGKFGAVILMIIGLYGVIENLLGTAGAEGGMIEGVAMITAGLSLFGIRAKLPPS